MTNFGILTPFWCIFWPLSVILHSLRLNINILENMGCFKCFLKCFYQIVFGIDQFLDFKLTYSPIYRHFCDFVPFLGHLLASKRYFAPFEAKYKYFGKYGVLQMIFKRFVQISF